MFTGACLGALLTDPEIGTTKNNNSYFKVTIIAPDKQQGSTKRHHYPMTIWVDQRDFEQAQNELKKGAVVWFYSATLEGVMREGYTAPILRLTTSYRSLRVLHMFDPKES